jgi:hypothetical protein
VCVCVYVCVYISLCGWMSVSGCCVNAGDVRTEQQFLR